MLSHESSVLLCHIQSLPLSTTLHFESCLSYIPKHGLTQIWFKMIKQGLKFQVHRKIKQVPSSSIVQVERHSNWQAEDCELLIHTDLFSCKFCQ